MNTTATVRDEELTLYIDMDGVLALWEDYYIPRAIFEDPKFFLSLEPCVNMVKAVQIFIKKHPKVKVQIRSSVVNEAAIETKNEWLDCNLPQIPMENRTFPMVGTSKSTILIGKDPKKCFLLDDFTKNLLEWRAAGAIGIKFLNGDNGTTGRWTGDFVVGRTEPEILADTLYALMTKTY